MYPRRRKKPFNDGMNSLGVATLLNVVEKQRLACIHPRAHPNGNWSEACRRPGMVNVTRTKHARLLTHEHQAGREWTVWRELQDVYKHCWTFSEASRGQDCSSGYGFIQDELHISLSWSKMRYFLICWKVLWIFKKKTNNNNISELQYQMKVRLKI